MFTGIIKTIGEITEISTKKDFTAFSIFPENKNFLSKKEIGGSIAVNGACVTITKLENANFSFDAINETLQKTNFKEFRIGNLVNLEPAMTLDQSLDGHLVQGHIDTIGEVISLRELPEKTILKVSFPPEISELLAFKGSITINGVSLTISDLQEDNLSVDLIPHTLRTTVLKDLKKGQLINIETDLIARHIKRLLDHKATEARYEYLKERNLI